MIVNVVSLNLPATPGGELPRAGVPIVAVNGVKIEGVRSIKLEAGCDGLTEVTVRFIARVDGKVAVRELTTVTVEDA